jgi:hypothetical protein
VCCASAGAERRGGVLCADPAYVVIPQKEKKEEKKTSPANRQMTEIVLFDIEVARIPMSGQLSPSCSR